MFDRLTPDEARQYAAFRLAYDEIALRDLAWLLKETDGPIDALDYSIETIDELWRWAIDFVDAGLPGIPDDAVSMEWIVWMNLGGPERVPPSRVMYDQRRESLDDLLEAYERSTLRAYFPDAEFRPMPKISGDQSSHRPILYVGRQSYRCMGRSRSIDREPARLWRPPDLMSKTMLERFPPLLVAPPHNLNARLADMLRERPAGADDPRRIPPYFAWRPAPEADPPRSRSSFEPRPLYIARIPRGSGDEEDPRLPMAPEPFVAALTSLGYRTFDGDAPTAEGLRADECGFRHPDDETIVVQTEARDGELVDLLLQPLSPTRGAWRRVLRQMRGAAKKVGARIAEEEDWD